MFHMHVPYEYREVSLAQSHAIIDALVRLTSTAQEPDKKSSGINELYMIQTCARSIRYLSYNDTCKVPNNIR